MADYTLQLQADNIPNELIEQLLVVGPWKPILSRMYTGENLLIEGCRGAGKTMLMRSASLYLRNAYSQGGKVLGVHTTFKRYLATLPPPNLQDGNNYELSYFRAWINARILSAVKDTVSSISSDSIKKIPELDNINWSVIVSALETTYRGDVDVNSILIKENIPSQTLYLLQGYTYTSEILKSVVDKLNLDLLILFLDDAAHALDTRAQGAFFTAIKSLYDPKLAFKISVYPAVTRYGLDFAYGHDAVVIPIGDTPKTETIDVFIELLEKRSEVADSDESRGIFHQLLSNNEWIKLLAYCANGNPRGLLRLVAQIQTTLGSKQPEEMRFEDVRIAITTVIDKHLDNMVPGVIKDLDPRLLKAAEYLLHEFRQKISDKPGPYESGKPRGYLAVTNSMQVPYLCQAALKLLVAANVLIPEGPARLSKRETGTLFLLHPGFMFRDNVIGVNFRGTLKASDWLSFFSGLSSRIHAEVTKSAELWQEIVGDISSEPLFECFNGHPINIPSEKCSVCGEKGVERSPVQVLLDKDISVLDLSDAIKERLYKNGFTTVRMLFECTNEELDRVEYIGEKRVSQIKSAVSLAVDEFVAG
ncbi:hypothetical protein DEU53_103297 [Pantoea sp. AG1095]|uniref:ORC-CDC6 family AAA ATPase n=1 Tax=Gammaproteobacteria TaxID=1236 RepID=UPI000D87E4D5|nr:helix-hairpin-helix domain-containing protein [Pantoea sp. AG1095]PYG49818.1 hypothetical protein DEU53_103297 [Pantoea sp. AG1095]